MGKLVDRVDLGLMCRLSSCDTGLLSSDLGLLLSGERVVGTPDDSGHAAEEDDGAEHADSHHVLGHVARVGVGQHHARKGDDEGSADEGEHGSDAELEGLAGARNHGVDAREAPGHEGREDEGGERVGDDRGSGSAGHDVLLVCLGECRGGGGDGNEDEGDDSLHDGLLGLVGLVTSDDAGDGGDEEDGSTVSGADKRKGVSNVHVDSLDDGEGKKEDEDDGTNRHDRLQGNDLAKVQVSPHSSPYG